MGVLLACLESQTVVSYQVCAGKRTQFLSETAASVLNC